ncbi:MAG: divalent metal cation transporter [Armatimonadota bacterium]
MNFLAKLFYTHRRIFKAIKLFLIISGPGIIVMVADNDAAGITTYAVTGAKYGYKLIWFLLVLIPIAYYIQEMTMRLGVVTKRGHAESIFTGFGPLWGWFSLANLAFVNWLTLITEFIGMAAAFSIFGVPPYATVIGVCLLMGFMVLKGRYWTWEKIALLFCFLNLIYIPIAFMIKPSVSQIMQGFVPNFPGGITQPLLFFLMANIGTTITPWMLYFQQSAVVDKGMKEKDIPWGKFDTLVGAVFTVSIAVFIVIVTGTILKGVEIESAAQAARMLMELHPYLGTCLAIGLFNAGLLGAICITLASSWAFGEVFGWAHSLNNKIKEAPWFYANYFITLITAGLVILIPRAPLITIALFVQVASVILLPASLVFLILLLNDEKTMGEFKNSRFQNFISLIIIIGIIIISALYAVSIILPDIFKG